MGYYFVAAITFSCSIVLLSLHFLTFFTFSGPKVTSLAFHGTDCLYVMVLGRLVCSSVSVHIMNLMYISSML